MLRLGPLLALAFGLGACDPTPAPPDAPPIDAFERADSPVVRPDAPPPVCAAPCGTAQTCCDVEGVPTCVTTGADPMNCGACGTVCAETRRGDSCRLGACACGDVDIGCLGGPRSTCCLGVGGGGRCADLYADFDDCGDCNVRCDAATADHCEVGTCACGAEAACAAGDTCCAPRFGGGAASCVDRMTNRDHCGECQNTCPSGDVCRDGLCVSGRDAGPRDAGGPDAGSTDAGADAP